MNYYKSEIKNRTYKIILKLLDSIDIKFHFGKYNPKNI